MHPFSDLDIGVYVEKLSAREHLKLELSLALEIDQKLGMGVSSDVRVEFETVVRKVYFDFFPVLQRYQNAHVESIVSGKHSLEK